MTGLTDTDVAVVGCGPVGATLAILLGQLGRSVVVIEKWPSGSSIARKRSSQRTGNVLRMSIWRKR